MIFSKDWRKERPQIVNHADGLRLYFDAPLWNAWARCFGGWKPYRTFLPLYWWHSHYSAEDGWKRLCVRILWIISYQRTERFS